MLKYILYPVCVLLFVASCTEKKSAIPSYIQIDTIKMTSDSATQGSNRQRFRDAWVYVNDNLIGAFELPAKVPVLNQGNSKVNIYPGVSINGLASLRAIYTPVIRYQTNVNFKPDAITTINPTLEYDSLLTFRYLEDFEGNGMRLVKGELTSFDPVQINDPTIAYQGRKCALLPLSDNNAIKFECRTLDPFQLPKGARSVFLEMNYKSNTKFVVALAGITPSGLEVQYGILGLNPSDTWRKIYVTLSPAANQFQESNNYKVYFNYQRDTSIAEQRVYLDNLKVLY